MDYINYDYMRDIKNLVNNVKSRKKGKKYSFDEHLKALIIALLSNHRWGDNNIRENMETIDKIFHNYDEIIVESIIQQFCLLRSANICGENPNCERCKIRNYCHYNKKYDEICN